MSNCKIPPKSADADVGVNPSAVEDEIEYPNSPAPYRPVLKLPSVFFKSAVAP